jgi:hypothetical protein
MARVVATQDAAGCARPRREDRLGTTLQDVGAEALLKSDFGEDGV